MAYGKIIADRLADKARSVLHDVSKLIVGNLDYYQEIKGVHFPKFSVNDHGDSSEEGTLADVIQNKIGRGILTDSYGSLAGSNIYDHISWNITLNTTGTKYEIVLAN